MARTKIVLDSDIIIHFAKGGMLNLLPRIFKECDYIVLDGVYNEIKEPLKSQLDNHMNILKTIKRIDFAITGDLRKELAVLKSKLGMGESVCMLYCKHNNCVVGSSNIRDIKQYCQENGIIYLTTFDFLYYAIHRELLSIDEARNFVREVKEKGSKLPDFDIGTYISDKLM